MLITSGSYKVTRFSGYNNMDWEVSFLKHFSIFVHLSIGSYVSVRSSRNGGGGGRGGSMPSRFALYKLPVSLKFVNIFFLFQVKVVYKQNIHCKLKQARASVPPEM